MKSSFRALDPNERFSATTTLTVNVLDSDDLDPRFTEETYTAKVTSGVSSGALRVLPEKIRAEDGDTLRSRIRYSFASGSPPSFRQHFSIDPDTGIVRQTRPVQKGDEGADLFDITVKAEEATPSRRFAKARLLIQVRLSYDFTFEQGI